MSFILNLLAAIQQQSEQHEDYFTLVAIENNVTISTAVTGNPVVNGLQYRTDLTYWRPYTPGTEIILAQEGDFVQFQNTKTELNKSLSDYMYFVITGMSAAIGNIMSLLNYSDSCNAFCFCNLFLDCNDLALPPELPATTLAESCYRQMFLRAGIFNIPDLPATILPSYCYSSMFMGCNNLTDVKDFNVSDISVRICTIFIYV